MAGSEGEPKSPAHLPQDKWSKLQGNGKVQINVLYNTYISEYIHVIL